MTDKNTLDCTGTNGPLGKHDFNPRDPTQLDALMELANGATKGPWTFKRNLCFCGGCEAGDVWRNDDYFGECTVCKEVAEYHDLPFIAASREAVPALIEEIMRLREDNMKLAHAIDDLTNCGAETDFKIVARYVGAICKNGEAITLAREALKAEGV